MAAQINELNEKDSNEPKMYFADKSRKEALREFTEDCTMHGIKYFYTGEIIRKCFWLLLVTAGFALTIMQVAKQCDLYRNTPVSTSIDFDYPTKMKFPAIAICNSNLYRVSMAWKYNVSNMIDSTYEKQSNSTFAQFDPKTHDSRNMSDFLMELDILNKDFPTSSKFLKAIGHQIDDMLLDCSNIDGSACYSSDFIPMNTDYGNCYIFNYNQTIVAGEAGTQASISFNINLETYEFMAGPSELSSLKEERLNEVDGGTCIASNNMTYFPDNLYSVFTCQQDKLLSAIDKNCSCFPNDDMPRKENGIQLCDVTTYFGCVLFQSQAIAMQNQTCKEACSSNYYKTSLSLAKFPEKAMNIIQKRHGTKILSSFNISMEAKTRTDNNLIGEMNYIISTCFRAISLAKNFSLLPNQTTLPSNFVRLNESSKFRHMVSEFAGFASVVNEKMGGGDQTCLITTDNLLNATETAMNETQQMNFNITSPSSLQLAIDLFNAWNTSNWENFFSIFQEDGFIYQSSSTSNGFVYQSSSTSNGQNSALGQISLPFGIFNKMIGLMNAYQDGNITKSQWADNNTQYTSASSVDLSLCEQIEASYSTLLCNQFQVLENLKQYLIQFDTDKMTQLVFQNLDDYVQPNVTFWTIFTYVATAKFQINVTCGVPAQYCFLFLFSSTSFSDAMLMMDPSSGQSMVSNGEPSQIGQFMQQMFNQTIPESTTCFMPEDYSSYMNLFRVLKDNKEILLRDVNSILAQKEQICDDMKHALINLNANLKKYLNNWDWNSNFWSENILGVKVFFSELSREKISQSASYTFYSLICDIGGTLGLFLGASILTFFEVVDLLIWGFCCKFNKKKHQINDQKGKDVPMKVNAYYNSS